MGGVKPDPDAPAKMDIALADLTHSRILPFNFPEDMKMAKVLEIARTLPANYKPPGRHKISGMLLNTLYDENWKSNMSSLLKESRDFGLAVFGDGATIVKTPLINFLVAGVNNNFAQLDIVDCTEHCAATKKKDAKYIATLAKPLIKKIEAETDQFGRNHKGVVDMVLFDGASNVQKGGEMICIAHPRITLVHGAEHVASLFFSDCFKRFQSICNYQTWQRSYGTSLAPQDTLPRPRSTHIQRSTIKG